MNESNTDNVVVVESVTKAYDGKVALCDVSFSVGKGECFGLLGPNGAGKTTLLRILTDILRPDSGRVTILGDAPGAVRSKIGYLPEERGLYRKQRVGDILSYLGRLHDLSAAEAARRTDQVLVEVGMHEHIRSRIDALSKGMAQRIQLAAALINDPEFVILDEPFSGLDPLSVAEVSAMLGSAAFRGRTVVLSTHQMAQADRLCDRIVMLNQGKVVLSGSLREIRAAYGTGAFRIQHDGPLTPLPGVVVERIGEGESRVLPPQGEYVPGLLKALMTEEAGVTGFSAETPSLEEIFIQKGRIGS